jgi:hypothetical protein
MVKCNGFTCNEDIITFDDIDNDEQCVAIKDDICTICDNITNARLFNPQLFNNDPIKACFGIDKSSHKETDEFWSLIKNKCKINRPNSHLEKSPEFYVAKPSYDILEQDFNIITDRIDKTSIKKNETFIKFITTLYKIALDKQQFSNKHDMKRYIKDLLITENCPIIAIHEATELPMNIQILFSNLASSNVEKFDKVKKLLNTKNGVCLEAIIDKCNKILSSSGPLSKTVSPISLQPKSPVFSKTKTINTTRTKRNTANYYADKTLRRNNITKFKKVFLRNTNTNKLPYNKTKRSRPHWK